MMSIGGQGNVEVTEDGAVKSNLDRVWVDVG
jgi:hypothetical protein